MSGHSKWSTIRRHKAVVDAKRGKIFSVIGKELTIAARNGGGDPEFNPRLRTQILKAKSANMPSDNIDRAIKKGTGELPGVTYEELTYEGYAPGGVGIIVEVTTDNKNRSASDVRSVFTKTGGNLATPGALSFNFKRQGQFLIDSAKTTEDALLEAVIDAGVDDVRTAPDYYEVLCPMGEFDHLSQALEKAGIQPESAEIAYLPNSTIPVTDSVIARQVLRLISSLEELEDVQNVFSNYEIDDTLLEEES